MERTFIGVLIFMFLVRPCNCAKVLKETSLHENLFRNYCPQVRPVLNTYDVINVRVQVYILRIGDLSEKDQILRSTIWVHAVWTDQLLSWNMSDYDDIDMIVADKKKIWTPDILIVNEVGNKRGVTDASGMNDPKVWYNGEVHMWTFKQLKSTCKVDSTKFPFDIQHCYIDIGKWYNPDHKLNISPISLNVGLEFFEKNEEWSLLSNKAFKEHHVEANSNYSRVKFLLQLKRRPLFNALNLMLPLAVLIVLNQLCFLLPIEGGEKIGFGMSTFLTFVVFLTLISNTLPQSSVHMSIFSIYLVFQLGISGLIIALEVIVLHVYYHKQTAEFQPPFKCNIWSYLRYIYHSLHRSMENKDSDINLPLQTHVEKKTQDACNDLDNGKTAHDQSSVSNQKDEDHYHKLAVTMDKVFACVITSLNLASFLVLFILLYL